MAKVHTNGGGVKVVAENRKARHDYDILDTVEAGIVLEGTEVKALRDGKCNLTGSYATVEGGQVFAHGIEIQEYSHGNLRNHVPKRMRKLLLHRQQIRKLDQQTSVKGCTLIPLRLHFRGSYAKVDLAVAKGRALYDKRAAKAEKEAKRDIARATGPRSRSGRGSM